MAPVNRPLRARSKKLDVVVYDIQDISSRSYTFISTMVNVMKVCAAQDVEFCVLDRPDPLGGDSLRRFRSDVARLAPRLETSASEQIAANDSRRRALF